MATMTICTTIPQLSSSSRVADIIRCNEARAYCEDMYPQETWIQAYTDGSATKAVADGGAGVFIMFPDSTVITESIPTGINCSNYKAEVQALLTAVQMVKASSRREYGQVVFLTDALSVLEALKSGGEPELTDSLKSLAETYRVAIQWIPAHCGIPGNEAADRLAKEGAKGVQIEQDMSYHEKRTIIKSNFRKSPKADDYHTLTREEQVILIRLRTGHNRLNYHMCKKLKLAPSTACNCQQGDQTTEHILQSCPNLRILRVSIWPDPTPLQTKLFGDRVELEKTAKFIISANIRI